MKKVSLIIPCFNQGQYLPACVDHCLFQTYPDLEIIIVDGGSTDNTKKYLAGLKHEVATRTVTPVKEVDSEGEIRRAEILAYPQTGRDLTIITFEKDIGATNTYIEGLARATGYYCTYVVGDDLPHPHMIEELAAHLEKTGADFAYSDLNIVDDQGRIIRQVRLPDYDFEACFGRWFHLGVSRLYKTEWHDRVGLMDKAYECANDYDHYLRMAMAGARFTHLPKVLYSVRHHNENRKKGQHTDERYARLLEESKRCAQRARQFLARKNSS